MCLSILTQGSEHCTSLFHLLPHIIPQLRGLKLFFFKSWGMNIVFLKKHKDFTFPLGLYFMGQYWLLYGRKKIYIYLWCIYYNYGTIWSFNLLISERWQTAMWNISPKNQTLHFSFGKYTNHGYKIQQSCDITLNLRTQFLIPNDFHILLV